MVAVQGVGAEGVGKPLGSRSSDVGHGSVATNLLCPRNVRLSPNGDRIAAPQYGDAMGQQQASGRTEQQSPLDVPAWFGSSSTRSKRPETVRERSRAPVRPFQNRGDV